MATRIALVDDHSEFRREVRDAISSECKKRQFDVVFDEFVNGRRLTGMIDDGKTFDVYFLDVQMEYMTGIQLAEYIRRIDEHAIIVFLSSYEAFAIQGYTYQAFDYMLKQNWKDKLPTVIDRIQKKVGEQTAKRYLIQSETKWESVYFKDILYMEKQRKNVVFHCINEKEYHERIPLMRVFEQFPQDDFIYVNRGQIVNLRHIIFADREIVRLSDNTVLGISRYMLDEVRQRILALGRTL